MMIRPNFLGQVSTLWYEVSSREGIVGGPRRHPHHQSYYQKRVVVENVHE
jgi:hypothetical protein